MAFSDAEKAAIRSYLGYPAINRSTDVALEGAMTTVELEAASEDHARAILVELGEIDTAIKEARGRLKAATVDSITLRGPEEIKALRSEGRRLTARLARLFGVRPLGASWSGGISGTVRRS